MQLNQPLTFEEIFHAPKPATLEGLRALGVRGFSIAPGTNATEEQIVAAIIDSLVAFANDPNPEEMDMYYDPDTISY